MTNQSQCQKDLDRDGSVPGVILIDGVDLNNILRESPYDGRIKSEADLSKFIDDHIISKMKLDREYFQHIHLRHYLLSVLHQGASLHTLLSSLREEFKNKSFIADNNDVKSVVKINITPESISITNEVKVFKLYKQNPETLVVEDSYEMENKTEPLISGSVTQKISLNIIGNINHTIKSGDINYGLKVVEDAIDKRTVIRRIIDLISNLLMKAIDISEVKKANSPALRDNNSDVSPRNS